MIEVANLTKAFGHKLAVDKVSFKVEKGEVLGFLGPNGAGKSTTMRMITGYLPRSGGRLRVGGFDPHTHPGKVSRLIGYLPENAPLYNDMTVTGFLNFIAELRGMRGSEKKKAVERVIDMCFLESVRGQSIDTLSKGYRHRTCFAQSVLHDPEVLVLDEPTDGLDPNQKHEVRSLIKRMGEEKAIVFSTHILEEVEAACTRAIIIDRGKIVANGTPDELKSRAPGAGAVVVSLSGASAGEIKGALSKLGAAGAVESVEESEELVSMRVAPGKKAAGPKLAAEVAGLARDKGWQLRELHTEAGRLDDVFRTITLPDTEA